MPPWPASSLSSSLSLIYVGLFLIYHLGEGGNSGSALSQRGKEKSEGVGEGQ